MSRVRVAVWCGVEQLQVVARVAACDGIELVGVCGVDGERTSHLAHALDSTAIDDPRQLAIAECDAIWLAADTSLASETLALIAARNCVIATAMQPATLSEFAEVQREAGRSRGADPPLPRPAPLLADWLTNGDAAELLRQFGPIEGATMALGASAALGGVGARALEVADAALRLLGAPETVFAGFAPIAGGASMHEDLRRLAGTLTLHLRAESASLAATVSTHGGFGRSMTFFGPAGRVEHDGRTLRWMDHDGRVMDELRPRPRRRPPRTERPSAADGHDLAVATLIAESLRAAAADRQPAIDLPAALAICEATRLSCRTRAPESPAALRQTLAASPPR